MIKFNLFFPVLFFLGISPAFSQKLDIKFGDISAVDLEMTQYKPDPGADAVILSDRGAAKLVLSGDNLQIELERDVRIKIINQKGFDYANFEIPYGTSDKVHNIEASTFNLVNGKIVETKISKKAMIIENANKYEKLVRIAFPNINEGSIIECKYRYITKSLFQFIPWDFQTDIPVRYSEFTAAYPDFFYYNGIVKGDLTKITKKSDSGTTFFGGYNTTQYIQKWIGINIPAFVEESYITGKNDHLLKLEFELASVNFPGGGYEELTPTYKNISTKMLTRSDFGEQLKGAYFLEKYTKEQIAGISDGLERLNKIQHFVATKMIWNGIDDYTTSKSIKKAFNEERGNSAEINLILIAMLRQAGIIADPVILSTRSNGSLHPYYAMYQKFNYVIALVQIQGKEYLVDATNPLLPYNVLPFECLNHQGRLIHPTNSRWINLKNNERNFESTLYNLRMNENGILSGQVSHSFTYYNAYSIRKFIKLESLDGFRDYIKSKYANLEISDLSITNTDSISNPLNITFNIVSKYGIQATPAGYILDPYALFQENEENPFSSEERKYPIDFGCPTLKTITFSINIPEGYYIKEMPNKISLKLPNNNGTYLYSCEQIGNSLTIHSKFDISATQFKKEDYLLLREFFAQLIKKQSELIVISKKPNNEI